MRCQARSCGGNDGVASGGHAAGIALVICFLSGMTSGRSNFAHTHSGAGRTPQPVMRYAVNQREGKWWAAQVPERAGARCQVRST